MPPKPHAPSLSREAVADADAAAEWYALAAANDYLNEIKWEMGMLAQFPKVGETSVHNTWVLPLHKFPYSLIYRLQGDTIRIIASHITAAVPVIGRDGADLLSDDSLQRYAWRQSGFINLYCVITEIARD